MLEGMDGEPGIDAFVSGGYLLAQPYVRSASDTEGYAVPEDVFGSPRITASPCEARVLPSRAWFSTWLPRPTREEQEREASRWRVPVDTVGTLVDWTSEKTAAGRLLHWDAFADVATAREFARRFLPRDVAVRLLGLGLRRASAADFLRSVAERDAASTGGWGAPNGIRDGVERGATLEPGGTSIGYEVLSVALGEDRDSWHCESLTRHFVDEYDIRPEAGGLLRTYADAEKVAAVLNEKRIGCTVGMWRPWLIVEYRLDPSTS
jgi:hypothetical protein